MCHCFRRSASESDCSGHHPEGQGSLRLGVALRGNRNRRALNRIPLCREVRWSETRIHDCRIRSTAFRIRKDYLRIFCRGKIAEIDEVQRRGRYDNAGGGTGAAPCNEHRPWCGVDSLCRIFGDALCGDASAALCSCRCVGRRSGCGDCLSVIFPCPDESGRVERAD